MQSLNVYIDGVGLLGPGIENWAQGAAQLRGEAPAQWLPVNLPAPALLPAAERRRAGPIVRVSQAAAQEAVTAAQQDAASLLSIFTSSSGDGINCHEICATLASDDRLISPTRFHNSVHNVASGYWGIATGAMPASTALCACDGSFAAGLLEAMVQTVVDNAPVLLVAYDSDYPEPLKTVRPIGGTLGAALVLSPVRTARSLGHCSLSASGYLVPEAPDAMEPGSVLERLCQTIPAARSLPLLRAVARAAAGPVRLEYLHDAALQLDYQPC